MAVFQPAVSLAVRNFPAQERSGSVPSVSWKEKSLSFSLVVPSVDYINSFKLSKRDAPGSFNLLKRNAAGEGRGAVRAARFPFLGQKDRENIQAKIELVSTIAPLDRGVSATAADAEKVEKIVQKLEKLNPTKEPLKSPLLSGKWKLLYTTSETILKKSRPKLLRPNGPIYQAINTDTLRAQNVETWPFYNQVTANLEPINEKTVIVKFDYFKISGLYFLSRCRHMDLAIGASHHASTICSMDTCFQDCLSIVGAGEIKEPNNGDSITTQDCLSIVGAGEIKEPNNGDSITTHDDKPSDFSLEPSEIMIYSHHFKWCGLCGSGNGRMICGHCLGEGSYPTRPGLAGERGRVGWARCKTCLGNKTLPCLLCNEKN